MSAELSQVAGAPALRWKPYPAYKDSGVEWLGEVPDGWKVQKLKHIAKVNLSNVDKKTNEGEDAVKLCNYVDVYYNDYITPDLDFMTATASPDQIDKFALKGGDVIITKDSESWEDIAVPAYVPADLKGVICGYHLAHVRPNYLDINGEYLFWSLCAPRLNNQFRVEAHGITRFGLGKYGIDNSLFLVPPINEQQSIARFLDDRTRKIDSLIEKKQKLIELLKEERAAVINQAVTKGLDPRAPMRDSGVEWLGEVPEGWEVKKLKYLVTLVNEKSNSDSPEVKISLENIESYTGKLINLGSEIIFEGDAKAFIRGDVLFNKLRPYLAKVYNAKTNGVCVGELLVLRPSTSVISDFLYYRVLSEDFIKEVNGSTYGAKMPRASWEFIGNLIIPFPTVKEQKEIVKFIESESAKTNHTIAKVEKEIALLQEYRTALISEVVTGKIDVRSECEIEHRARG